MNYQEYKTMIEAIKPESDTPEWQAFWQKNIALSQHMTHYQIVGEQYLRIPYGNEDDHLPFDVFMQRTQEGVLAYATIAEKHPCHDCHVVKGQLHVPGCKVECCPKCYGQSISCDCEEEDEEESSS